MVVISFDRSGGYAAVSAPGMIMRCRVRPQQSDRSASLRIDIGQAFPPPFRETLPCNGTDAPHPCASFGGGGGCPGGERERFFALCAPAMVERLEDRFRTCESICADSLGLGGGVRVLGGGGGCVGGGGVGGGGGGGGEVCSGGARRWCSARQVLVCCGGRRVYWLPARRSSVGGAAGGGGFPV